MTLYGVTWPDVVAVFSHSLFGKFLLGVVLGWIGYVAIDAYRALHPKGEKPSPLPITDAEIRSIPLLYPQRTLTGDGRKGFRADHQHVVVDLAERRQNWRVH